MQHFVLFFAWTLLFSKNFRNFAGQKGIINNRCGTKITTMDKGKDNVLNIIAIVVTVISILITIVNPFDKFDTNIRLIVGGIYIIVILVLGFYYRLSKLEKLIEENLDNRDFQNYWEEDIYIPMDIIDGTGKRIPLFSQLMSMIKEKHAESKYICILGDTGSGKTDALVHFLEEYVNHFRYRLSMPSPIRLFTMNVGYAELMKNIQEEYPTKKERKK